MLTAYWLSQLGEQARTLITVTGRDAQRFVQGLITADLRQVVAGQGRASALLTVKGKMISDAVVLVWDERPSVDPARPSAYALAVPQSMADKIVNTLQRHAIIDEVEIAARPEFEFAVLCGDDEPLHGLSGVQTAAVDHPLRGLLVVGKSQALAAALDHLPRGDDQAFAKARIDAAIPAWGHELTADVFPPEVGFVHAVSYEKGCYLGQEPLARIHARGQTNWVMVHARSSLGANARAGELAASDRPHAGKVTTTSRLCTDGLALAIVHRKVAQIGTHLHAVADPVELWEVVSPPLGADIRAKS